MLATQCSEGEGGYLEDLWATLNELGPYIQMPPRTGQVTIMSGDWETGEPVGILLRKESVVTRPRSKGGMCTKVRPSSFQE